MKAQPNRNYESNAVVMTPRPLARALVAALQPSGRVLEPCAGDGAFVEALKEWVEPRGGIVEYEDISDGQSQGFEYWNGGAVDWVVTNPPWNRFAEFMRRSLDLADHVALLSTVNHWWTKRRVLDMRDRGFGYRQLILCDWPVNSGWPSSGFQLGMMHVARGWTGPCDVVRL